MNAYTLHEARIISLLKPCLKKPFVFLETANFDKDNQKSFLFKDFPQILTFNYKDNVDSFFKKTEECLAKKLWLCGFFTYEFGYFLEPALYDFRKSNKSPLAWLGVCKKPNEILCQNDRLPFGQHYSGKFQIKKIRPSINYKQYVKAISSIKTYLENGTNYQTNFTFKVKFDFSGDILSFYFALKKAQPTSYMALINTGESFVISLSPELFFRRTGKSITTRPMKGSLARGATLQEDKIKEKDLLASKKIKAENLMIVDLLRNDLGKISRKVSVPQLFTPEKYRTIYQMTSTISAILKKEVTIKDTFTALFPSGSVTGAPKIKTMEIIKRLEKEPRGIYTGAIGYISPNKNACFNVAIRTIELCKSKGEMGIGGGIIYDSRADKEYEEALLKAKFLTRSFKDFSVIETILYDGSRGYFLLPLHLKRLKNSCEYFSINLDFQSLVRDMGLLALNFRKSKFKVRIVVNLDGSFTLENSFLEGMKQPLRVKISDNTVDPRDIFLYHKTTHRGFYDRERIKAAKSGFFETIFFNSRGELTEGSISNVFVLKNKNLYTPPVKCGLLPGILREHLLQTKRAQEKVLYRKDVLNAQKLYIGNSVRGLLSVQI